MKPPIRTDARAIVELGNRVRAALLAADVTPGDGLTALVTVLIPTAHTIGMSRDELVFLIGAAYDRWAATVEGVP